MKKERSIAKEVFVFVILLLAGAYWTIVGANAFIQQRRALDFSEIGVQECKEERYVAGYVDSYLVKRMVVLNQVFYTGVSQTLPMGGKSSYYYTIPVKDDFYIRIRVTDEKTLSQLEQFSMGVGKGVYIEGQLSAATSSIDYEWYKDMEQFADGNMDKIIGEYVIKEISFREKMNQLYLGTFILFCAILYYKEKIR